MRDEWAYIGDGAGTIWQLNASNVSIVHANYSASAQIMSAGSTDVQIGAFLLVMRIKGETIDEVTGGVQVLREFASGVKVTGPNLVDIVGTGGDGANLFNVSTAACCVVAAAGFACDAEFRIHRF